MAARSTRRATRARAGPRGDGLPADNAYLTVLREAFDWIGEGAALELYFGATSGTVFGSADAGASWFNVATSLPPVLSVTASRTQWGSTGSSTVTMVPPPGGDSSSRYVERVDAVAETAKAASVDGSAPPTPSSPTCRRRRSSSSERCTKASLACAYLATLVSASAVT